MTPALAPDLTSSAMNALADTGKPDARRLAKTKGAAQDFEAVFLNNMFQQMFAGVGKGPFSGGPGAQIWQSFLTDEYAKSFAKTGGIGIADQVQRMLLAQQEVK
jgi:Rod binding domain-containing protein